MLDLLQPAWMEKANCKDIPVGEFIQDDPRTPPTIRVVEACASCEVRQECLEAAVQNAEMGYWGGTTARERTQLVKEGRVKPSTKFSANGKPLPACGTPSGYGKHRRLGETACMACTVAYREQSRQRMARKRGSVGTRRRKSVA